MFFLIYFEPTQVMRNTSLSEVLVSILFWAEFATGTVEMPAIVIALDIIKRHRSHYFPVGKGPLRDTLHFQ